MTGLLQNDKLVIAFENNILINVSCQMWSKFEFFSTILNVYLGHPNKVFRFPSPDRPNFLEKKKKKIPELLFEN